MVNNYQYDEWGNILTSNETISNPFKYAGEIYDQETGLYYLRARYYDPTMGRFINEDSFEGQINNPLSLNLYTYCYNNPMNHIDPSGHSAYTIKYALYAASDYLGKGYKDMGWGRYISADGTRQVRFTDSDLAKTNNHAGAPHMNFEVLVPIPSNQVK